MNLPESINNKRREIISVGELPPLPLIGQQLLSAISDDDLSLKDIAGLIEQDPGLTARIIGLANSAFFANQSSITSVEQAIVRNLGLDLVKSLTFSMIMTGLFDTRRCPAFSLQRYWSDAMLSALLSQQLGRQLIGEIPNRDQLYLAGLLHNLGMLLLAEKFPAELQQILDDALNSEESLILLEERHLGINHHQAASWLGQRWRLPDTLLRVLEFRHDAEYEGQDWELVSITAFAANWAKELNLQADFRPEPVGRLWHIGIDDDAIETVGQYCDARLARLHETARQIAG